MLQQPYKRIARPFETPSGSFVGGQVDQSYLIQSGYATDRTTLIRGYHALESDLERLFEYEYVTNRKGIFEYLLGGSTDKKLLALRLFDDKTKRVAYNKQTQEAKATGESNCPLCAIGDNANKNRIYELKEMDADHVSAWSKGGDTSADNCQMLCTTHNRAKGNR